MLSCALPRQSALALRPARRDCRCSCQVRPRHARSLHTGRPAWFVVVQTPFSLRVVLQHVLRVEADRRTNEHPAIRNTSPVECGEFAKNVDARRRLRRVFAPLYELWADELPLPNL